MNRKVITALIWVGLFVAIIYMITGMNPGQAKPDELDYNTKFLQLARNTENADTTQKTIKAILVDNGQPPVTTYEPVVDAEKNSIFASVLDAAAGLPSPAAQPDLMVPEPVASAMYDSIYGVIQKQLTPEQALDLVEKALESTR